MFLPASDSRLSVCLSVYLSARYLKNGWMNRYQTLRILLGQWHKLITFWWSCNQMPPINSQNTKTAISSQPVEILNWYLVCSCTRYIPNTYYKQRYCYIWQIARDCISHTICMSVPVSVPKITQKQMIRLISNFQVFKILVKCYDLIRFWQVFV